MTDFFLQIGLSNACFSLALTLVAVAVSTKTKRPHLAHLLWLLVFVKLVTPPIWTIPVFTIPLQPDVSITNIPVVDAQMAAPAVSAWSVILEHGKIWLPLIWLAGCFIVFIFSLIRIYRFNSLLKMESVTGNNELQATATKISGQLGLKTVPTIYTTSSQLSPMVWWIGGKVRIILPSSVLEKMNAQEWRWILAHELAHVRRRDHLVRWLEWLACVCFWWNPVVWWAQRNLRAMEEICCDALVLSCLNPKPRAYANSLLTAIEYLTCPVIQHPGIASAINSGGFLKKRFKMISSNASMRPKSHLLQACILLFAVVVLPFGITYARAVNNPQAKALHNSETNHRTDEKIEFDYEAFERRIKDAISTGKMTRREAGKQLEGYKKRMEYAQTEERMKRGIEEGRFSRKDVETRLNEMRLNITDQNPRVEDERVAEYRAVEANLRDAVKAGKISKEDAEKRLIGTREWIFGKNNP